MAAHAPLPYAPQVTIIANHHGKARKWLLVVAALTLISGFIFFAMGRSEVEKQITEGETALQSIEPSERDALIKEKTGMTWDEVKAHDRGMVTLMLATNVALAFIYFGLWFWAKSNPFTACLIALLLFVTTIVVNAVLEPSTIYQGILVKIFFTVALIKAVSAGREERNLAAAT